MELEYSWRRITCTGTIPTPRRYSTSVLYDGKMYNFGGLCVNKKADNKIYILNLQDFSWQTLEVKGTPPSERAAHSLILFHDVLYVFGGSSELKYDAKNDMFMFDLKTNTWSQIEQQDEVWPAPRFHHSAVIFNDKMYVFGGSKNISTHYGDFFEFSFDTKKWKLIESPGSPTPRAGHLSFVVEDKIFVFGGFSGKGGYDPETDTKAFTPSTNQWEDIEVSGTLPFTHRALDGVVENHVLYVFGGYDGKVPQRGLVEFHFKERKWKAAKLWLDIGDDYAKAAVGSKGMEPTPRYGHTTIIQNKVITVFGGSGSMYLNDVIQFDLDSQEEE